MPVYDHGYLVNQCYAAQPAEKTVDGALAFTLRVIAALPASEGAGLLLKPSGDNIADYQGQMVSAGRICYPDGHLYKVLTDVPTTNGPSWQDNGMADSAAYIKVTGGSPGPTPAPTPCDLGPVLTALSSLQNTLDHLAAVVGDQHAETMAHLLDLANRTDELKRIAQQPQHYAGTVTLFGVKGSVSLDRT